MNSMRSELILTALAATLTVLTPATAPARTRYTAKALNYANKNGQFSPVAIGSGLDVMGTVFLKKERGYSAFIGNGGNGVVLRLLRVPCRNRQYHRPRGCKPGCWLQISRWKLLRLQLDEFL